MGGFHLFEHSSEGTSDYDIMSHEEDAPLYPLAVGNINKKDTAIDIDISSFTVPTEAEINNKGKKDWLAKSIVLIQTSWFVMQCIAWAIKHLPVTHLEIVTLAYAVMNFVIYIFWWNKPLNVNRPVRVFQKSGPSERQGRVREPISLTWETIGNGLVTIFGFIAGVQDVDVDLSREDRVPRFWADSTDIDYVINADVILLGVGICFGAIHCVAWVFSFPTHGELLMWRILSVAITAVPIYIFSTTLLASWAINKESEYCAITALFFSPFSGCILYILARAVTLVLAFISLRDLPPGAYETVHWTTFVPHI